MSQDSISDRVSRLEVRVKSQDKRLEKVENSTSSLDRLATIVEMQVELNKEQNKQLDKFSDTLERIDDNLTNLNRNQEQLNVNQNKLGERVDDIEQTLEEQKVDIVKVSKKVFAYIMTGIGGLIFGYLAVKFGIK